MRMTEMVGETSGKHEKMVEITLKTIGPARPSRLHVSSIRMGGQNIEDKAYFKLPRLHHLSIAKVVCIIAYWFGLRMHEFRNKHTHDVRLEGLDAEVLALKKGLDNAAQAIASLTTELVKATTLPIPENEVWNLLVGLSVDEQNRYACYLYLIQKPEMLRALLGCPWEFRKDLLFQMMKGADK